jgi:hypothetical protein
VLCAEDAQGDEEVQAYAAQALGGICVSEEHTQRFLDAQGLDSLLMLSKSEDGEVVLRCGMSCVLTLTLTLSP